MKRLTSEDIDTIRKKANIVNIISNYIPLVQAGSNYKAICPFHDDHNPSLSINVDKQIYKCFVCGQGGNVFGFVKDYEQISFIEAVKKVGEQVGFDFSDYHFNSTEEVVDEKTKRFYSIMNQAQQYLEYLMNHQQDETVSAFLAKRNLSDDIIKTFKVGYADPQYPLVSFLLKKGFKLDELEELQLTRSSEHGPVEFFNHRILFPITNEIDQIVAFTARAINQIEPKYINSATTPIYQKSAILYNYPKVTNPLLKNKACIVCEGVMDVIAFYRAGLEKCVATLGTALSDEQIHLLKKLNCTIVLAFDGDRAGESAIYKIGKQLRQHIIKVAVIANDSTLDPDEILNQRGKTVLVEMIQQPIHWMEFILKFTSQRYGLNSYEAKKKILEICSQELLYEDTTDQLYFTNQLSLLTGFSVNLINQAIENKQPIKQKQIIQTEQIPTTQHILEVEKTVLAHILAGKNFANEFKLKLGYLIDENATNLALLITNLYNTHDTINVADCLNLNLNQLQQAILLEISEDPVYQYEKNLTKLSEAINQVALMDIDNLLRINQQKIMETIDPAQKMELLKEKIKLQQQKDKHRTGGVR